MTDTSVQSRHSSASSAAPDFLYASP
jgi:hypothetical protein